MIFEKGEVVWAKIQGFPWWPGVVRGYSVQLINNGIQVAKVIDQKGNSGSLPELIVNFIGDNSQ